MATPNEDQLKDLAATYAKGVTLAVLANQFGVSIPTVTKWVRKGGATIRPRGQRKKGTVDLNTRSVEVFEPTTTFTNPCNEVGPTSDSFVDSESTGRQIFQME